MSFRTYSSKPRQTKAKTGNTREAWASSLRKSRLKTRPLVAVGALRLTLFIAPASSQRRGFFVERRDAAAHFRTSLTSRG